MAVATDDHLKRPEYPGEGLLTSLMNRSSVLRILVAGRLLVPLGALAASLVIHLFISILIFLGVGADYGIAALDLMTGLFSFGAMLVGAVRLRTQLLKPLAQLEKSVADVCEGEPWSTLPMDYAGVLGPVTRDLDSLSGELIDLYEDMDNRVARQTKRLSQQTVSLKFLYDVASSINKFEDVDELLLRYLPVLKEILHGKAVTVQLTTTDGKMRLVGSLGADDILLTEADQLPIALCQCGKALSSGELLCEHDAKECSVRNKRRMYGHDEMEVVSIPLEYHGDILGIYRIYVKLDALEGREDLLDLLSTIGSHLGIAIVKQRSDEEARWLSIIQERTALAHELHDSLAQTLASLRFQVRMLDETLEQGQEGAQARRELERIGNGLDEAHAELRELLNSFRAPVDQRGLEPALEKLTERFRQETDTSIFFQRSCRQANLDASEEMQLLRIVQECLANIRKHAKAHTVRVLLNCKPEGEYLLLVEDDGVGFDNVQVDGRPGEHIGLSIMEERARRLGANLKIESEPGEGTRVELTYITGTVNSAVENPESH
ncbi:ATP-binding protein [Candidatus Vondammii sp. HM_W22]|uniref:ATP-binding protein n=1 Tax=Candidatus Vondammii sp. HM_W22 TaxID=2687299 RepID=UPI001F13F860|nr:ATP-binding protein [Candidatus Vondammii sp. HM_W22]